MGNNRMSKVNVKCAEEHLNRLRVGTIVKHSSLDNLGLMIITHIEKSSDSWRTTTPRVYTCRRIGVRSNEIQTFDFLPWVLEIVADGK